MFASRFAAICLILASVCPYGAIAQTARFDGVDRVVAFGDVHGAYDALVEILQTVGVLDADAHWSGSRTHVVSLGDLLDRGPRARAVIDLLMRLEKEAEAAGGRVHVLLGNHEVMNLSGDLRYVSETAYADFAEQESTRELDTEDGAAAQPAGFFGRRAALAPDGRYGEWLLERPVMVIVNDTAFVHGGLPPLVARLGVDQINTRLRGDLSSLMTTRSTLAEAGILPATGYALEQIEPVRAFLELPENQGQDGPLVAAARRFISSAESPLFDQRGPVWYRGTALCHALMESGVLDAALDNLGVARVAVGHSTIRDKLAKSRFGGRVIMLDTGMLTEYYGGRASALVIEHGVAKIIYPGEPPRDPDAVTERAGPGNLSDQVVERMLRSAPVVGSDPNATDTITVSLSWGKAPVAARFRSEFDGDSDADFVRRELAAYRLDKLLGLGLVPVTVPRDIDGRAGIVTALPERSISEAERIARGIARDQWCATAGDYRLMFAFDALIANGRRSRESIRYDMQDWRLVLVDHAWAFGTSRKLPSYREDVDRSVPEGFIALLASLDKDAVREELQPFLSRKQINALLRRRDAIVDSWPTIAWSE